MLLEDSTTYSTAFKKTKSRLKDYQINIVNNDYREIERLKDIKGYFLRVFIGDTTGGFITEAQAL